MKRKIEHPQNLLSNKQFENMQCYIRKSMQIIDITVIYNL